MSISKLAASLGVDCNVLSNGLNDADTLLIGKAMVLTIQNSHSPDFSPQYFKLKSLLRAVEDNLS